jgi:alpha-tubulin suppressor-like RCC1 family protein
MFHPKSGFNRPALRFLGIAALVAGILTGGPGPRAEADQNEQPGSTAQASIAAGGLHTCAIVGGGTVRCWGDNAFGQLGLGNTNNIGDNENPTQNVNLGGATATAITAGDQHTCALLVGGNVRCWGYNFFGQLGLGNTNNIGDDENPTQNVNLGGATATAITAGEYHTCALLVGGNVRCWGYNFFGQLGLGNTNTIGDNENPTTDVNLGGLTVASISAGGIHSCALLVGGTVRCWGDNTYGQLGLGNTSNIGDNENPTTDVNLGTTGTFPFPVQQTAVAIASGYLHTCAVMSTGGVRCWGLNTNGQLGLGNTNNIGDNESPIITNVDLSNGDPFSLVTVTAVSTGGGHSCALLLGGGVRCWGENVQGQLGLGNTNTIGDNESPVANVNLGGTATAITEGDRHTCAVLNGGSVRCWGANAQGQLGLSNTNVVGDNESPTQNATNVTVGPDTIKPTIAIGTPTPNQTLASSPVTISGFASDVGGITTVQLAIYRPVNGGQYWNGTTWQTGYTDVAAALAKPNSTSTVWEYVFSAPPGGTFGVAALAYDPSGNIGIVPLQSFTVSDTTNPTISALSPSPNQTVAAKPVTITGIAADNAAISDVQIAIYRPINGTGQYWNGTAWQSTYVTNPTTLTSAGNSSTGWTYNFNPPQTGGNYYFTAMALDTNNNYTFTPFTPFKLPDTTPPNATLNPATNSNTTGTVTINGNATDNNSLYATYVAIYRVSDATYWNGTTWQPTFTTNTATMSAPGTTASAYSYFFTPPTPGYYLIAALPIDTNYNYNFVAWNTINAT